MRIENNNYMAIVEKGVITKLIDKTDSEKINLIQPNGNIGAIHYTLFSDNIKEMKEEFLDSPYACRKNDYSSMEYDNDRIVCVDKENKIETKYYFEDELIIESQCFNDEISQFAINLGFNFMGFKGTSYINQFLPTSPYTSEDGRFTYCIMTRPSGSYAVVVSEAHCEGWKIDYKHLHYIEGFQIVADFDKTYKQTDNKYIKLRVFLCDDLEEIYARIGKILKVPYVTNVLSGGFHEAYVKTSKGVDSLKVVSPSGAVNKVDIHSDINKISFTEYGLYTIYPCIKDVNGLSTTVWFGQDDDILFKKSMDSIRKPYGCDHNLCENGMFVWAMLAYMRRYQNFDYKRIIEQELEIIMGKNGKNVPRRSILPYQTEFPAYHISSSDRIQEQFTGISILLEAYMVFRDENMLNHAILSLEELINNRIDDTGRIWCNHGNNDVDYTTVCAPVITIVDMALFLEKAGDDRSQYFKKIAVKVADYLVKRGFDFPTEGLVREDKEKEYEDGSISCTALSVLYVCAKIEYKKEYIDFAKEILKLHRSWTIYTPDARMYQSSFRWWETLWEGDGEGPAICAGHAWTIWRAEALFWYGILTSNDKSLIDSWNGFITNFSKITHDGKSYACYEADYIRGGGAMWAKKDLLQLKGEDLSTKYILGHDYPKHYDNSLSRYVWVRYDATWQDTAAVVYENGTVLGINIIEKDGMWIVKDNVQSIFVGSVPRGTILKINSQNIKKIYCNSEYEVDNVENVCIIKII